jgi:hypothetical protein
MVEPRRVSGCFLIAATGPGCTSTGLALLGSISDDPYDIRTFVRLVRGDGEYAHVGTELVSSTDRTLAERGYLCRAGETTRGVNEAGLAFTIAGVFESPEGKRPSSDVQLFADLSARLMRECASVDDAVELLESVPAAEPSWQVLLADARGAIAQLEIGSGGTTVVGHHSHDDPGMLVSVNCYVSREFEQLNNPATLLSATDNNNRCRLDRGAQLAEIHLGDLSVPKLAAILADHVNDDRDPMANPVLEAWGYSICNHGTRHSDVFPHEDLPWGTVSAEILDPAERTLWYAYGWPCGNAPTAGDQYLQERSWGAFLPFSLDALDVVTGSEPVVELTTMWGEVLDPATRKPVTVDAFAERFGAVRPADVVAAG